MKDWEKEMKDRMSLSCQSQFIVQLHYQRSSWDSHTGSETIIFDQPCPPSPLTFSEGCQYLVLQKTEDNMCLLLTLEKSVHWEILS